MSEELDENKAPRNLRSLMRYFRFSSATEAVTKSIQKYKNEKLSRFGLKSMHLTFLCCLYKAEDGMTSAELAREMCIRDRSVTCPRLFIWFKFINR